jgi:hypothetical protein
MAELKITSFAFTTSDTFREQALQSFKMNGIDHQSIIDKLHMCECKIENMNFFAKFFIKKNMQKIAETKYIKNIDTLDDKQINLLLTKSKKIEKSIKSQKLSIIKYNNKTYHINFENGDVFSKNDEKMTKVGIVTIVSNKKYDFELTKTQKKYVFTFIKN